MDQLVDENTAAVIINNPSNPCGSVYSKAHISELADCKCCNKYCSSLFIIISWSLKKL